MRRREPSKPALDRWVHELRSTIPGAGVVRLFFCAGDSGYGTGGWRIEVVLQREWALSEANIQALGVQKPSKANGFEYRSAWVVWGKERDLDRLSLGVGDTIKACFDSAWGNVPALNAILVDPAVQVCGQCGHIAAVRV